MPNYTQSTRNVTQSVPSIPEFGGTTANTSDVMYHEPNTSHASIILTIIAFFLLYLVLLSMIACIYHKMRKLSNVGNQRSREFMLDTGNRECSSTSEKGSTSTQTMQVTEL
ncbi:hypothetical protein VCUG_01832 [Vavraia culicis subsp. floridensis]|uniref:Uncharacterized protein n=1 Tax=Vavraia culicis (isolate floridensis) TaxID=948595 RepID=L2GTH3_VAVCU|nr:uncharacterized protein VCUG_01832 [Vavraia culicis subsp. floridensis]ELA46682.1 hypothetical protein VCUG_01832 [Vavraia culicis subsp. floridensis]